MENRELIDLNRSRISVVDFVESSEEEGEEESELKFTIIEKGEFDSSSDEEGGLFGGGGSHFFPGSSNEVLNMIQPLPEVVVAECERLDDVDGRMGACPEPASFIPESLGVYQAEGDQNSPFADVISEESTEERRCLNARQTKGSCCCSSVHMPERIIIVQNQYEQVSHKQTEKTPNLNESRESVSVDSQASGMKNKASKKCHCSSKMRVKNGEVPSTQRVQPHASNEPKNATRGPKNHHSREKVLAQKGTVKCRCSTFSNIEVPYQYNRKALPLEGTIPIPLEEPKKKRSLESEKETGKEISEKRGSREPEKHVPIALGSREKQHVRVAEEPVKKISQESVNNNPEELLRRPSRELNKQNTPESDKTKIPENNEQQLGKPTSKETLAQNPEQEQNHEPLENRPSRNASGRSYKDRSLESTRTNRSFTKDVFHKSIIERRHTDPGRRTKRDTIEPKRAVSQTTTLYVIQESASPEDEEVEQPKYDGGSTGGDNLEALKEKKYKELTERNEESAGKPVAVKERKCCCRKRSQGSNGPNGAFQQTPVSRMGKPEGESKGPSNEGMTTRIPCCCEIRALRERNGKQTKGLCELKDSKSGKRKVCCCGEKASERYKPTQAEPLPRTKANDQSSGKEVDRGDQAADLTLPDSEKDRRVINQSSGMQPSKDAKGPAKIALPCCCYERACRNAGILCRGRDEKGRYFYVVQRRNPPCGDSRCIPRIKCALVESQKRIPETPAPVPAPIEEPAPIDEPAAIEKPPSPPPPPEPEPEAVVEDKKEETPKKSLTGRLIFDTGNVHSSKIIENRNTVGRPSMWRPTSWAEVPPRESKRPRAHWSTTEAEKDKSIFQRRWQSARGKSTEAEKDKSRRRQSDKDKSTDAEEHKSMSQRHLQRERGKSTEEEKDKSMPQRRWQSDRGKSTEEEKDKNMSQRRGQSERGKSTRKKTYLFARSVSSVFKPRKTKEEVAQEKSLTKGKELSNREESNKSSSTKNPPSAGKTPDPGVDKKPREKSPTEQEKEKETREVLKRISRRVSQRFSGERSPAAEASKPKSPKEKPGENISTDSEPTVTRGALKRVNNDATTRASEPIGRKPKKSKASRKVTVYQVYKIGGKETYNFGDIQRLGKRSSNNIMLTQMKMPEISNQDKENPRFHEYQVFTMDGNQPTISDVAKQESSYSKEPNSLRIKSNKNAPHTTSTLSDGPNSIKFKDTRISDESLEPEGGRMYRFRSPRSPKQPEKEPSEESEEKPEEPPVVPLVESPEVPPVEPVVVPPVVPLVVLPPPKLSCVPCVPRKSKTKCLCYQRKEVLNYQCLCAPNPTIRPIPRTICFSCTRKCPGSRKPMSAGGKRKPGKMPSKSQITQTTPIPAEDKEIETDLKEDDLKTTVGQRLFNKQNLPINKECSCGGLGKNNMYCIDVNPSSDRKCLDTRSFCDKMKYLCERGKGDLQIQKNTVDGSGQKRRYLLENDSHSILRKQSSAESLALTCYSSEESNLGNGTDTAPQTQLNTQSLQPVSTRKPNEIWTNPKRNKSKSRTSLQGMIAYHHKVHYQEEVPTQAESSVSRKEIPTDSIPSFSPSFHLISNRNEFVQVNSHSFSLTEKIVCSKSEIHPSRRRKGPEYSNNISRKNKNIVKEWYNRYFHKKTKPFDAERKESFSFKEKIHKISLTKDKPHKSTKKVRHLLRGRSEYFESTVPPLDNEDIFIKRTSSRRKYGFKKVNIQNRSVYVLVKRKNKI